MSDVDYGDLSPYEIARLKNIRANQERLQQLGLNSLNNEIKKTVVQEKERKKKAVALKRKMVSSRNTSRREQKKPRQGVRQY